MVSEARRISVAQLIADGDLVINDGYRAKNSELSPTGLPFARAQNINAGFYFDRPDCFPESALNKVGIKVSQPGDVVFTSKGTVGRFARVRADTPRFVYSPQLCFWRSVNPLRVDPLYLFYWMNSREFYVQFKGVSGQTDMAEYVSLRDQRAMEITLPELTEQHRIGNILGTLDDKIELNRRMNQTLEKMAAALFKSWFIDFLPVRAKMAAKQQVNIARTQTGDPVHAKADLPAASRDAAQAGGRDPNLAADIANLFPDTFQDSELGPIPEGWAVESVGDVTEIVKGRSYKSAELKESDTALVSLKSFQRGGGYREDGLKPYTGKYKPNQVVSPGEIVIAMTDVTQNAEVVGRPAIVMGEPRFDALVASLDTSIVRAVDERVSTPFLYGLFGTERFRAHTYAHSSGTTVLHLAKTAIPSFRFACPPAVIQQAFLAQMAPFLDRQAIAKRESRRLAELRDTLLPKLLSDGLISDVSTAQSVIKGV